jgi:hypothetical protein
MMNEDNIEDEIMTDIAVQLLVLEGVPFLAFVYYLLHKKQMYLLETQSRNLVIYRFFQGHNDAHLTVTCEV